MAHPDRIHPDELHDMRRDEIRSIWEGADESDDKTAGPRMLGYVCAGAILGVLFFPLMNITMTGITLVAEALK